MAKNRPFFCIEKGTPLSTPRKPNHLDTFLTYKVVYRGTPQGGAPGGLPQGHPSGAPLWGTPRGTPQGGASGSAAGVPLVPLYQEGYPGDHVYQ